MITASSQFEAELRKLIEQKIDIIKNNMVAGSYAGVAEYARQVGIVYAYKDVAEELCNEANKLINER
jgi:hypothetical protein